MSKLSMAIAATVLLSTTALAQSPSSQQPSPSAAGGTTTTGDKVAPIPAPDASTQPGQERGNAQILEKNKGTATQGSGTTAQPTPPARPDPSVSGSKTGSPVSPVPAPDATTQPGQERGNAQILEQNKGGTSGGGK